MPDPIMTLTGSSARFPRLEQQLPLHERVYCELRSAIMRGKLKPGDAVTLRGLAAELGTSAMPIRDAVQRLVSTKALEVLSNRTVRVPLLSSKHFTDLTNVRYIVEGAAVQCASHCLSLDDIRMLEDINKTMKSALKRRAIREVYEHNYAFHFAIYRAADNEPLLSIIENLWLLTGPYLAVPWLETTREAKATAGVPIL